MTEDDIYPLLATLAGGKVYPYVAPLDNDDKPAISPPWIIFSIVSDVSTDVLCGQAESRVSVQVDVYSATITESRALRDLALTSLKQLNPTEVVKIPGYEPDYRLYRSSLDFKVTP